MSDALAIARALRGKSIAGGYLVRCPVPTHGNGKGDRNPSLFIKDGDKPGCVLVHCYAGCDTAVVLDRLRSLRLIAEASTSDRRPSQPAPEPSHEPDPEALAVWRAGKPIEDRRYLLARGITVDPPPSLRWGTASYLDRYPLHAMI